MKLPVWVQPGTRLLRAGVFAAALGAAASVGGAGDAEAAPRADGPGRDVDAVGIATHSAARAARPSGIASATDAAPETSHATSLVGVQRGPMRVAVRAPVRVAGRVATHLNAPHRSSATSSATPTLTASDAREAHSVPTVFNTVFAPGPIRSAILAVRAATYGYPLLEFERFRSEAPGLNTLWSQTGFAEPGAVPIWRPNADTLYSRAALDLGGGPVVLSIPDMGDRYFSFQLNDPYTNAVSYLGTRSTGSGPGRFAITWDGGPSVTVEGAQTVTVPYRNIVLLGRTLAGDAADQSQALALIDRYSLTPTGPTGSPPASIPMPSGLAMLDAISAAMELNPPPGSDAALLRAIAGIGVGPGLRVADAGLNPLSTIVADIAVRIGFAAASFQTAGTQYIAALGNGGWAVPPPAIGDYGTDYRLRAGVFFVGPWANIRDEAIYLGGLLDQTLLPLNGRNSYRIHFAPGEEPPADAFWSVTVYDRDGALVANPLNRYSVSNSRPGELVRGPDGSVTIILAQGDPGDATANWLPVPDASFSAYLRLYLPRAAALDGSWQPPPIIRR